MRYCSPYAHSIAQIWHVSHKDRTTYAWQATHTADLGTSVSTSSNRLHSC